MQLSGATCRTLFRGKSLTASSSPRTRDNMRCLSTAPHERHLECLRVTGGFCLIRFDLNGPVLWHIGHSKTGCPGLVSLYQTGRTVFFIRSNKMCAFYQQLVESLSVLQKTLAPTAVSYFFIGDSPLSGKAQKPGPSICQPPVHFPSSYMVEPASQWKPRGIPHSVD